MFGFLGRKRLKIECRSVCDRGLVRNDNQDCLFADPARGLFCVADGMGGAEAGAMASAIVCEEIGKVPEGLDFRAGVVAIDDAIVRANARIVAYAAEHGLARMGSTAVALLIDPNESARAAVAGVGDSRVYRRRGVRLERMTEDHRVSAYSHLLTRAVGVAETIQVDWLHASVMKGDVWLLCSDGVHEMIPDSTIDALIARGGSADDIALRIADCVRRAGARDNYSIVAIRT